MPGDFPNYSFFAGTRLIITTIINIPTTRIAPIIIPAHAQLMPSGPVCATGFTGVIGLTALVELTGLFAFVGAGLDALVVEGGV